MVSVVWRDTNFPPKGGLSYDPITYVMLVVEAF